MHTTKNMLPDNSRQAVIDMLQTHLAASLDLASQAKQAHWNIKGTSFIALHELFDTIHTETMDQADMLAERLVILGGQTKATVRATAAQTGLTEYPLDASDQADHVEAFSSALAEFGGAVRKAIGEAEDIGDAVTADLLTEITRAVDKSLWFVEAHR
jgi:starvation-inducible DNA-binding protein